MHINIFYLYLFFHFFGKILTTFQCVLFANFLFDNVLYKKKKKIGKTKKIETENRITLHRIFILLERVDFNTGVFIWRRRI